MRQETVLREASFDEKLVVYWMCNAQLILLFNIITIPLMPLWFLFGRGFHRQQHERMKARLTERSLNISRGVVFRMEKNVPLDKIQDLTMKEGPLLRWLGLSMIHIETAGQNVGGTGGAHLVGVVDAPAFRDAVLEQRDRWVEAGRPTAALAEPSVAPDASDASTLREIRDSLRRIEGILERHAGGDAQP